MKRTTVLWAMALLALAPAGAQDATDSSSDFDSLAAPAADTATPKFDWGTLKYSGDQELSWRWGAYDPATRTGGMVDSKMSAEYKRGDVKVVAAAQVRNNEFVPGETAVFYAPGTLKFGLGYQEFSWGVADKRNPTDTLNARDYRYGVDAPRLVNPAASVSWYPASWVSIDVVYEPWKEQSKYPTDLVGKTSAGLSAAATKLKASVPYYAAYNPTVTADTNNQDTSQPVYGARTNFFIPGLDLSLSYVYDKDPFYTPVVTMKSYSGFWAPQKVDLVYKRIHRLGIDAKTTVEQFGFWLESAYNITEASASDAYDNRHNSLDWTLGMDFNYGPGSVYYVNFQYVGEYIFNYDASTNSDYQSNPVAAQLMDQNYMSRQTYRSLVQSLGTQTEQWTNGFTVSAKWPLDDELITPGIDAAVALPVSYDTTKATRYASGYFKPQVDYKPIDSLHILFGAELNYAWVKNSGSDSVSLDTANDRIGVYTPQNNVFVKVDYKWNGTLTGN